MRPLRVYLDTCVFGGAFDIEFSTATQAFFAQVRTGRFHLVVSALVLDELMAAPLPVRELLDEMLPYGETIYPTEDALQLQAAYLDAGILTPKWADDALHVAMATVTHCDLVVSWNFRHIVHFEKVPRYNAVNTLNRYGMIAINTPAEVLEYDE
jgi:hypothetical protein